MSSQGRERLQRGAHVFTGGRERLLMGCEDVLTGGANVFRGTRTSSDGCANVFTVGANVYTGRAYRIGGIDLHVQVVEIEVACIEMRLQTIRLYFRVWKDC
jgi:hypothetical protein